MSVNLNPTAADGFREDLLPLGAQISRLGWDWWRLVTENDTDLFGCCFSYLADYFVILFIIIYFGLTHQLLIIIPIDKHNN